MLSKLFLSALALAGPILGAPVTTDVQRRATGGTVESAGGLVVIDPIGVYIRASELSNGNIITGYAADENGVSTLRTAISSNGGASWAQLGSVTSGETATQDIDNSMPLVLADGSILFAFRNHDRETVNGPYTYYRITVCISTDGGVTFTYLSTVNQRAATVVNNGLWEPFLRIANDGSIQCYYSSENSATDQDNLMQSSSDGGATWSSPITVSGADTTSRDGMTGVTALDTNGNLICVFENTESGPFTIDYVLSQDDGNTWNTRTRLYTPPSGSAGAPQVVNVNGVLVTSFMSTEATGGATNVDGGQFRVVTSTDGGATWSASVVAGAAPAHWPGLWTVDATHFLALYSEDGYGAVSQLYELV